MNRYHFWEGSLSTKNFEKKKESKKNLFYSKWSNISYHRLLKTQSMMLREYRMINLSKRFLLSTTKTLSSSRVILFYHLMKIVRHAAKVYLWRSDIRSKKTFRKCTIRLKIFRLFLFLFYYVFIANRGE
jgi:hypothetical protein